MSTWPFEVAARIRAEVAHQRRTKGDLAAAMGMSRSTLARRLAGRTPWTVNEVEALAGLLEVDALELFGVDR